MREQTIRKRLHEEHRVLREIMTALRTAVEGPRTPPADRWLAGVRERFAHFRAHMNRRFALEEIGGLYQDAVRNRPTSAAEIEDMRRGHRDILASIESIQALLMAGGGSPAVDPAGVAERIGEILGRVQKHADREESMFSVFFTQDEGGQG